MSYESATSTVLLASQCAVCSRPLVDSVSVETGMGPVCREKHGYTIEVADDQRAQANKLVHTIATAQTMTPEQGAELIALGFQRLALTLTERLMKAGRVTIESDLLGFNVATPYRPEATQDWRGIRGRRWDSAKKANYVPTQSKRALWALLRKHFIGAVLVSPKGETIIG